MTVEQEAMTNEAIHLLSVSGKETSLDDVLALIKTNPHSHSVRPCETCRKITAIIGKPFWCLRVAIDSGFPKGIPKE